MGGDEIEVFLVLAEELHFGRTAARLRLPQPRVSRLIAALERKVGGVLFERTSRRVALTPLGEQFRTQLAPAWRQVTAAYDAARASARGMAGELRLGIVVTTPSEAVAQVVQAFEASYPECRVTVVEHLITGDDWAVWEPLRRGESDALLYWNAADAEPDLTSGPVLVHLDRLLLVGHGHRLAGRDVVHADELANERRPQLPATMPRSLYEMLLPSTASSGTPISLTEPVSSIHDSVSKVARGTIVHPTVAGMPYAFRDDVEAIPLVGWPPVPLGLTWCTAHENARIRALAETVRVLAAPESTRPPLSSEKSSQVPGTD
ncbi:MAG TPA: LysR family transcriptional regulator [Streptosporangiaceae bacterium]|nr:LysR family transcriptional regulator [Streptosporangiaceae bacterium]